MPKRRRDSMLKQVQVLLTIMITLSLTACQALTVTNHSATNSYSFDNMMARANTCLLSEGKQANCYRYSFPQRCKKFTDEMPFTKNSTENKLISCISTCLQATVISRSFGACSLVL